MRKPLPRKERIRLLETGCALMAGGGFFQAHEAFEDLWHSASSQAERDVWQGLAQVAAALVKHDRGEPSTAISLLAKAQRRLEGTPLLKPRADRVASWLDALAGPVTREMDLPSGALPRGLVDVLAGLLEAGGGAGDEAGGAPAGGDAPPEPLS